MPIFGRYHVIVTGRLEMIVPMTPNARHQRAWLLEWIAQNGRDATLRYEYEGVVAEQRLRFRPEGIANNLDRH